MVEALRAPLPPLLPGLPFTGPWLLAPMEGVTDPAFRDVLLELHDPRALGGAFTEFVRVTDRPRQVRELSEHLRGARFGMPVGLQLMGSDAQALARSARNAHEAGAPLVDLNFGCPAKGALRGCAGSALLREPAAVERLVAVCARALEGRVPLTAKIRAGFDGAERVEELARAVEAGGAALLTVHCRTRVEAYCPVVDWSRIARAVAAVSIPVCGNGGVERHADLARMREETGCALVMVGRGALDDPWVFSGVGVARPVAARFLLDYAGRLQSAGASPEGAAKRVKQLLRGWRAGGLVDGEGERERALREPDGRALLAWLEICAETARRS